MAIILFRLMLENVATMNLVFSLLLVMDSTSFQFKVPTKFAQLPTSISKKMVNQSLKKFD